MVTKVYIPKATYLSMTDREYENLVRVLKQKAIKANKAEKTAQRQDAAEMMQAHYCE